MCIDLKKGLKEWFARNMAFVVFGVIGAVGRISLAALVPRGTFDLFFFVALMAIGAGYGSGRREAVFVPLITMVSTDIFLYTVRGDAFPYASSTILLVSFFVWTGMMWLTMASVYARKIGQGRASRASFLLGTTWGVFIYDLWTNFGWWLGPFYPHTPGGLAACYLAAVPFMVWHMASTLTFSPLVYLAVTRVSQLQASAASRAVETGVGE